jgi:hypothetical protein
VKTATTGFNTAGRKLELSSSPLYVILAKSYGWWVPYIHME